MGRTDKSIVLAQIYKDFDDAISVLPTSYTDQQRATQGAALALKAGCLDYGRLGNSGRCSQGGYGLEYL